MELVMSKRTQKTLSFYKFVERFPNEEACREYLYSFKWKDGFVCPVCGNTACSKVHGRAHKWQCTKCSHQFSVTAGTMMEGTHLGLRKWFVAIWLMSRSQNTES